MLFSIAQCELLLSPTHREKLSKGLLATVIETYNKLLAQKPSKKGKSILESTNNPIKRNDAYVKRTGCGKRNFDSHRMLQVYL